MLNPALILAVCAVTVEVAGPKLPRFVTVSPAKIAAEASFIKAGCRESWFNVDVGGFIAWPFHTLRWYVVDMSTNLDDAYRKPRSICIKPPRAKLRLRTAVTTSFLTVTLHNKALRNPFPGNFDPAIPRTLEVWT